MKQAVLRLLAKEIDEMTIQELRTQFMAMDVDGDGSISFDEMIAAAEKCGCQISQREMQQTMFALNSNSRV
jgi:Ca2+-binding EF-hand superfamily protein